MAQKDKDPEIEIVTNDDDSLKILGELLANKTSRDLMKFLMNKSTYKMKISDELGVPFSLVEHHLKKLEKLGMVKITNKKLIKDGVVHKTYKITADGIFLMLNTTKEEIKDKGILKRIFKEGVKFAAIGITAFISSWIYRTDISYQADVNDSIIDFAIIPFIIIIIGLGIMLILEKKKKRV